MALPKNRGDREYEKFVEDASGNVALRTSVVVQDISIEAVEIKDHTSDNRVHITASKELTIINPALALLVGEVQASPTANTLLARVKSLETKTGEVQASPTSNTVLARLKDLLTGIVLAPVVKTIQTELLAITAVLANAQQKSSELDVSSIDRASLFIDHARDIATAFVGAGTEYVVEVSEKATGNDTWRTLYSVVCGIAAASSIVTDAEEAAAQTLIETGATIPAVGDIVFFKNAAIGNSEWAKVVAIVSNGADSTFTIQDGLTNTQAAGTYFNKAELFVLTFDLKSVKRLRVIVNNNNGTTNQNIVSRVAIITS